ncbi:MAG TPA: hypothetical protein VFO65_06860 [Acidimicrobiales bacterium]|nr:hypothetical protein [Acidimicrobiales bacterium]
MKITLLLCDMARVAEGKLDVLGAGWTVAGPAPVNLGIGMLAEVPWADMGEQHRVELELVDGRGEVVPNEQGDPLFRVEAALHTERPAGVLLGSPAVVPMALNVNALPVPPGGRYTLRATIDGQSSVDWEVSFSTRPAAGSGTSRL